MQKSDSFYRFMMFAVQSTLTPFQLEQFHKDGFLLCNNVFRHSEVNELRTAANNLIETDPNTLDVGKAYKKDEKEIWLYNGAARFAYSDDGAMILKRVVAACAVEPILLDFSRDRKITDKVRQMLDIDAAPSQLLCQIHPKLPGDGISYKWHQDAKHRNYATDRWNDIIGNGSYVVAITAIDQVTDDNGPLLVIPGSHKLGYLNNLPYSDDFNKIREYLSDNSKEPVPDPLAVKMQPGDTLFISSFTIHGSKANTSNESRIAFINGYSAPGANSCEYPYFGKGLPA